MTSLDPIVLTLLGDGWIGKSALLERWTTDNFNEVSRDVGFHEETFEIAINDTKHTILLRDTPGQEDHDRMRLGSFDNTNCFLLCYSSINKPSLKNITGKWFPDIQEYYKTTTIPIPIILVATKTDIRDDPNSKKKHHISIEDARRVKKEIGANAFIECSAKNGNGMRVVLEMAVKASIDGVQDKFQSSLCCSS